MSDSQTSAAPKFLQRVGESIDWGKFIFSAIITAIFVAISFLIQKKEETKSGMAAFDIRDEYWFGLLFFLMTYFLCNQIDRTKQISDLNKTIDDIKTKSADTAALLQTVNSMEALINKSIKYDGSVITVANNITKLYNYDAILQSTGFYALEYAIDGVKFEDGLIDVKGRDLSMESYVNFWDRISITPHKIEKPLITRITHSSEIGDRYTLQSERINESHFKFSENGKGTVFRIFIDRLDVETIDDQEYLEHVELYTELMQKMLESQVCCAYINVHGIKGFNFEYLHHDFCLISDLGYCARWDLANQRVKSFSLSRSGKRYDDDLFIWEKLVEYVKKYNYQTHTQDNIQLEFLEASRKIFIEKIVSAKNNSTFKAP